MKYMKLDQKGAILAEYVWIDGTNGVRTKTKVRSFSQAAISSKEDSSGGGRCASAQALNGNLR